MKKEKAAGVYSSIRSDMRILSKIYLEMEEGENMYGNANFDIFCKAMDDVSLKDDNIYKTRFKAKCILPH